MRLSTAMERQESSWHRLAQANWGVGFIDTLLRGVGQVMFQNNPLTGLLMLIGIFYNSSVLGVAAIVGLLAATLTAIVLGANRTMIRNGLFGYNGVLLGIGLTFFLQFNTALVIYVILGGVVTTIVMMSLVNFMGAWDAPCVTAPFVLTGWLFLFAAFFLGNLRPNDLIVPATLNTSASLQTALRPLPANLTGAGLTAGNLAEALFRGVGEVFFQDNLITGIIFLIAILVNSPISAAFALIGSAVGLIIALFFLGANGYWVYHGLYGFNSVLTAIALGGIFYVLTWQSALYAILGAIVATIVMASVSVFLSPWGLPALTGPFVITVWLFLLPKAGFRFLQPVPLANVATPERTRRAYLEAQAEPHEARPGEARPGEVRPGEVRPGEV